jgi:steroid delta-isomerase-like uncharacterized protein
MSEQHKALVRRLMEEVWSRGDLGAVDQLVADEYVGHSSAMDPQTRGTEGYKRFFATLRSAFPDFRVTIEDQIAEGDRVVSRWTARATHAGAYAGIPPSGKPGVMTGISLFRVAEGKVVECWTNRDDLGLLQQLGVVPGPARAG